MFGLGILVLFVLDAFAILAQSLPREALKTGDWIVAGGLFAIYLVLMIIAMFPGLRSPP